MTKAGTPVFLYEGGTYAVSGLGYGSKKIQGITFVDTGSGAQCKSVSWSVIHKVPGRKLHVILCSFSLEGLFTASETKALQPTLSAGLFFV